ncbi:MAG: alkaline phosphatase [Anaerolineaceae bacterium]|nr:alkaline phosphatase [Anaerolineaceae bacterium]
MKTRIHLIVTGMILAINLLSVVVAMTPVTARDIEFADVTRTSWTDRRRVILMIGDGMGSQHRLAGQWSKVGLTGTLAMDSLTVKGWIQTANISGGITDSAASATAMATGVRTANGLLGVDPDGERLKTILELAQEKGMMTGLVVTSQITNATPAGFAAHIDDRYEVLEIASQMLDHQVDVLLGGGEGDWLPNTSLDCTGSQYGKRSDGRNLVDEAITEGYTYACSPVDFTAITPGTFPLLGLFSFEKLIWPYAPTLAEMTAVALDSLVADPEGFFLMVEGSQIDTASHASDGAWMIDDVKTFDDAVQVALNFTIANPDTLLIVVADHETGGLSIYQSSTCVSGDQGPFDIYGGGTFCTHFSTTGHTIDDVPLSAMGPGSEFLNGTYPNTSIHTSMHRYMTAFEYNYLPVISR